MTALRLLALPDCVMQKMRILFGVLINAPCCARSAGIRYRPVYRRTRGLYLTRLIAFNP